MDIKLQKYLSTIISFMGSEKHQDNTNIIINNVKGRFSSDYLLLKCDHIESEKELAVAKIHYDSRKLFLYDRSAFNLILEIVFYDGIYITKDEEVYELDKECWFNIALENDISLTYEDILEISEMFKITENNFYLYYSINDENGVKLIE